MLFVRNAFTSDQQLRAHRKSTGHNTGKGGQPTKVNFDFHVHYARAMTGTGGWGPEIPFLDRIGKPVRKNGPPLKVFMIVK